MPTRTAWYLADLGEARGKQELFTRQSPQKLKLLREHALIESAVSSNRIEGVEVDKSRIGTLMFGKPTLRDRDEEEVRGYRDALKLVHEKGAKFPISEATIKKLHKLCRGEIWDAGVYKERYYEVLEQSSQGWHEGKHDPWPALNFLLFILTQACKEFEQRVGQLKSPRGEKTGLVEDAIARQTGLFSLSDLQSACPGVSVDLIRSVLKRLKSVSIECLGRGHTAKWRKRAN